MRTHAAGSLDKAVWGDDDFASMTFHDVTIRAWVADEDAFELALDLDYMFEWVQPAEGEKYFRFWIAPATLVFENVRDVRIDVRSPQGTVQILALRRDDVGLTPNGAFTERAYVFECVEGALSLVATGFRMFVRRAPVLAQQQRLTLAERGGVSFGRVLESGGA